MENWKILLLLLLLIAIVLVSYAVLASYLMVEGFVAIFNPETYNLTILTGGLK